MSVDSDDPLSGTTFAGRYHVERRLGMGGMGAVYLATQEPLGRKVGLKVLRPSLLGDPVAVQRFRNEAKIVAQLGHPHIVGIYEFDTTDEGVLFIAMEFLPGQSLGATLRASGSLPWERTLPIVRGIARALSAAHRRGVIHRDLKPDNIILVEIEGMSDFVKVLDFGIAKLIAPTENAANLTGNGFVPGTPTYIAPEQIMGGGGDDPRSDLYSLGVTWFEMLTGRRPFEGDSAMKIFLAHLNEPPPKVGERRPDLAVPAPVDALVRGLLAKDPNARPKDADALLAALDEVAASCLPVHGWIGTPSASGTARPADSDVATLSGSTPFSAGTSVYPLAAPPASIGASSSSSPESSKSSKSSSSSSPVVAQPPPATRTSETVESLLASRRVWTKRWIALSAMLLLAMGSLAYLGLNYMFHKEDRWGDLPIHDEAQFSDALGDAVQAYLDADRMRALAATQRVLTVDPSEPGALALAGLLADDDAPEGRAALFAKAKAALVPLDAAPGEGALFVELLDAAYHVPAKELVRRWRECGETCTDNVFALVAMGDVLGAEIVGDIDVALELLDRAIELAPTRAAAHERKTAVLLRIGRVHEAVTAALAGLKRNPESPALLEAAGTAHLAAGEISDAVTMLKRAVEKNASVTARLALARAYVVGDDELARKLTIGALLQDATPAQICIVSAAHGTALVGAGRGQSAYELLAACAQTPGATHDDVAGALMAAAVAFDALDDIELWGRVAALTHDLSNTRALPYLKTIEVVGSAIVAAESGEVDEARNQLNAVEDLDERLWPPGARQGMLDLVRVRVLALEGKTDDALVIARRIDGPCRSRAHAATINLEARRIAAASDDIRWLTEKAAYCREAGFQGAYVLQALILRAQIDASSDAAGAAARLRADLARLFPRLEDGTLRSRAQPLLQQ